MKQPVYLLSLTMSGIKNIDQDIIIRFYKKNVDHLFDISDYRTKAIYGENGAGKTAIVIGVQILKDLILVPNYLSDASNQKYLHEIINKKTNCLHLECEFCIHNNNFSHVYKYRLMISADKMGKYVLNSEDLYVKNANYPTAKYHKVYQVMDGELSYESKDEQLKVILKEATTNLLVYNTLFITLFGSKLFGELKESDLVGHLSMVYVFGLDLIASLDDPDRQNTSYARQSFRINWDRANEGIQSGTVEPRQDAFNGDIRIIKSEDYEEYVNEVRKLERFIKLFKRNLVCLEIDKKERHGLYECALIMNYGDYKVHISYESTGIKKLVRLFDYMSLAMDGKIVFIDEMDSNVNDVYLCKLIEFFKLYGNGQLCFTTHSTSPMEVLRDAKNSIDFISSDSRIVPWRKNGNFTPERMYRRGMIEYLPFNIEAEDFLGIIGD